MVREDDKLDVDNHNYNHEFNLDTRSAHDEFVSLYSNNYSSDNKDESKVSRVIIIILIITLTMTIVMKLAMIMITVTITMLFLCSSIFK